MSAVDDQLALPGLIEARAAARSARKLADSQGKKPTEWAPIQPIAQVLVDVSLAHLDRPFDYRVPANLDGLAQPGARVKVRFAGRQVAGFVVGRSDESDQPRLQPILRVVSGEPVLAPEIAELSAAIAARYAGTRADVLRLAVPARHARVEQELVTAPTQPFTWGSTAQEWVHYPGFASLLTGQTRVVMSVAPGDDWTNAFCAAAGATLARGEGVVMCVPDHLDVKRLDEAMRRRWGVQHHVVLTADLGPAARYRAFLALSRGQVQIVIGTRAAAFAPVKRLGLVAIWDDGDDLFHEPRAPYCHSREVLLQRAQQANAGALVAGYARSVEAQYLVRTGWATEVAAQRALLRERVLVGVTGDSSADLARDPAARGARLPSEAHQMIREALAIGPVLIQTPRAGYATRLVCDRCLEQATCTTCSGPLRQLGPAEPLTCKWCGLVHHNWRCTHCQGQGLRAPVLGHTRTAEEIGRSFPGVRVRTSSAKRRLETIEDDSIVVATIGAEPVAKGGYAGVLVMDTWITLARSDLRATEEAARRWANAIALVAKGGKALLVGDSAQPAVQALIRWDLSGLAQRELSERQAAHLPPASRLAVLRGDPGEVEAALRDLELPQGTEILGPVPSVDDQVQYVLRSPRVVAAELSARLAQMQSIRSVHKRPHIRVQIDPHDLG